MKKNYKRLFLLVFLILCLVIGIILLNQESSTTRTKEETQQKEENNSTKTTAENKSEQETNSIEAKKEETNSDQEQKVSSDSKKQEDTTQTSKKENSQSKQTTTHVHNFKAHEAKRWVENIVTVDDYETMTIYGAQFYTFNGYDEEGRPSYISNGPTYWFEDGFTIDDLQEIIKEGLLNMDENGLYNGVYYGNYVNRSKTEKKKVGSHKEDQGHYETYIDYWECSCGAKREA